MLKSLMGSLFGTDPTEGWPPHSGNAPVFDLEMLGVGSMRLGGPLEGARALGKPTRCRVPTKGAAILEYDGVGMDLTFHDGKLMCVAFTTATDTDRPGRSEPTVGGYKIRAATTPDEVLAWFGEPTSDGSSTDGSLRWIEFRRGSATLEFEFDEEQLSFVQIYTEGYA